MKILVLSLLIAVGTMASCPQQLGLSLVPMKLFLSRQRDGNYMLTRFAPIFMDVGKSGNKDFYLTPGDPIGIRHLCPLGVKAIFKLELQIGESIPVTLTGRKLEGEKQ